MPFAVGASHLLPLVAKLPLLRRRTIGGIAQSLAGVRFRARTRFRAESHCEAAQSVGRPHSDLALSIISFTAAHSLRSVNVPSANSLPATLSDR